MPQSDWLAGVDCNEDKFGNQTKEPDEEHQPEMAPDEMLEADEEISKEEPEGLRDDQENYEQHVDNDEDNEEINDDENEENEDTEPTTLHNQQEDAQNQDNGSVNDEIGEQADCIDDELDNALDVMQSHEDEKELESEDSDNDTEGIAELEDTDGDDDEEEITTDNGRQHPHRETKKPDICDGQHFEKSDEIEMIELKHNLFGTDAKEQLHEAEEAPIVAQLLVNVMRSCQPESGTFAQQHNYKQGVKKCGDRAEKAALKETKQQHAQKCFHQLQLQN